MPRQSDKPEASSPGGDVVEVRKRFAEVVNRRLDVFDVPTKERPRWLAERMVAAGAKSCRWQTAQYWIDGVSFPQGRNLRRLAGVLGVNLNDLVGPLSDDDAPAAYLTFLEREGATVTSEERVTLRLFPWPQDPVVADYRSLLAIMRANAER